MVTVTESLAALSGENLTLFYTTDAQLSNVALYVFYGPAGNAHRVTNSRVQLHIFSAAGPKEYAKLTISPSSPFYAAVGLLPRDQQGDEVCRALAFGLLKFFKELPEIIKSSLIVQSAHSRNGRRPMSAPTLFGEQHAANLASALVEVEDPSSSLEDIRTVFQQQVITSIDVDLVLPPGSITAAQPGSGAQATDAEISENALLRYGQYARLVESFGEAVFLPTSKLRRAPSKPTSLNRSRSFLRNQKLSLRRQMGEFVDTEERYVIKIHGLVNQMAGDLRRRLVDELSNTSFEPDAQALFPESLDKILEMNTAFLADLRTAMNETEEMAMQDLEADQLNYQSSRHGRSKDPTGAHDFAKVLLEWFPRLSDCYQNYIRASEAFPRILNSLLRTNAPFSQGVQQIGEQRLRSAIIEPVQRLPRYSLFIDTIVTYLPVSHPALNVFMKARDVVTGICALDSGKADVGKAAERLKTLVEDWPDTVNPVGRLISAVDVFSMRAPYNITHDSCHGNNGILLLFAETVVVLAKSSRCTLSARGLLAEADNPRVIPTLMSVAEGPGKEQIIDRLKFEASYDLSAVRFTEDADKKLLWMMSLRGANTMLNPGATTTFAYCLQGPYEGKVSRLTEEIAKARVEGRFSETERESQSWCLRQVRSKDSQLNMYTAVFMEGIDHLIEGRREPASTRLVVDHRKGTKGAPVGHYGVEITANVTTSSKTGVVQLETRGLFDQLSVNTAETASLIDVLAQRVGDMLKSHHSPSNPALTTTFLSFYVSALESIRVCIESEKPKSLRPSSPVKVLAGFLNGGGSLSNFTAQPKHPRTPLLGNVPLAPLPMTRSGSQKSTVSDTIRKDDSRPNTAESRPSNPLVRLEETFTGYVAALHSRRGNIVGKILRNRGAADELLVNAVYNGFIESPFDTRLSSESSIDVIFGAFEKFLRMAWKDQMGVVVALPTLRSLAEKNAKLFPGDFADFVKVVFADMAPQNKRAFVAIVKLLADLLEGCGNDGDRGALTGAFSELLVQEGNPHDYINLLDRMVDDSDRLFDDVCPPVSSGYTTPTFGSVSSTANSRSTNTGSLTSNASSLRRRFGLDSLLRQNSKTDADRPSMWRTLSKGARTPVPIDSTTSSISKASLGRSNSVDAGQSPARPSSRDRPSVLGAFDERPSSSHMSKNRLSTIGASPPEAADKSKTLKKKRRSSLSDLKDMMAIASIGSPSPIVPHRALPEPSQFNSSPHTPSPIKTSIMNRTIKYNRDSPQDSRGNPPVLRSIGNLPDRPKSVLSPESLAVKELRNDTPSKHKTSPSLSSIPTLGGVARERVVSGSSPSKSGPSSSNGSSQRLRLQSTTKLRERLQTESKAISAAGSSLQIEINKIGEEMARLTGPTGTQASPSEIQDLSAVVKRLESRIPVVIRDLTDRNNAIQKDLQATTTAQETKMKAIDQLYKEARAENELLYEKFSGELGKIVKALKGRGREDKEELVARVKEAGEEAAKVRKENARLRREMVALRALLKTADEENSPRNL